MWFGYKLVSFLCFGYRDLCGESGSTKEWTKSLGHSSMKLLVYLYHISELSTEGWNEVKLWRLVGGTVWGVVRALYCT